MKNKCGLKIVTQGASPLPSGFIAAEPVIKRNAAETAKPIDFDFFKYQITIGG